MFKLLVATSVLISSSLITIPVLAESKTALTVEAESNTVGDDWNANVHMSIGKEFSNSNSSFGISAGPGYFIDPEGEDEFSVKASLFYETALSESSSLDLDLDVYYLTDSDRVDTQLTAEYKLLF